MLWSLTSWPPRTTPEPIWAETPKLSTVGKKRLQQENSLETGTQVNVAEVSQWSCGFVLAAVSAILSEIQHRAVTTSFVQLEERQLGVAQNQTAGVQV